MSDTFRRKLSDRTCPHLLDSPAAFGTGVRGWPWRLPSGTQARRLLGLFIVTASLALWPPVGALAADGVSQRTSSPIAGGQAAAGPMHGIAMHGSPRLPAGFTHLPYVSPDAPKGGVLQLGATGSFDSLNPFIIRGQSPALLREYVFESLLARSADEAFSLYGLIAGSISVPDDRSSITFHLRPEARFADGRPITAADVVFSHRVLSTKGWPYHRAHYRKVSRIETPDPRTVRFSFGPDGDRELPLILGLMPVLPAHSLTEDSFERTTLSPPLGSGPYTVESVDAGRSIALRRNPAYWGRDLPIRRGMFNFDVVRIEYYREGTTLFEAFKAGQIDVWLEEDPARWAEGYDFAAVRSGRTIRMEAPIGLPAGMTGLAMNTRRSPFDDQRVRRALIEVFDAEWINRTLYHGQMKRTQSYFDRSDLASLGRPADDRERQLLAPFADAVRPDVMAGRWRLPVTDGSGIDRSGLKRAHALLTRAGYGLRGSKMVRLTDGRPLEFEFLASSRGQERLMLAFGENLKRLGIGLRIRQVDSAQYWARMKSFDFDMAQWTWPVSLSPGNEQINRWSVAAAKTEGTLNYPGVKEPAADAVIAALLAARDQQPFTSAVRALDRVLLSGDYVIPLFHAPKMWLAYQSRLAQPATIPLSGVMLATWWVKR